MDHPGMDNDVIESLLLIEILFEEDDDDNMIFLLCLSAKKQLSAQKLYLFSQIVGHLHPGSGNYERPPGNNSIVNLVSGFDELPISLQNSAIEMSLGITIQHFQWLCTLVSPWIFLVIFLLIFYTQVFDSMPSTLSHKAQQIDFSSFSSF
jgi:hypothetical protein